jgi:signal transduction histidine kinase
MKSVARGLVSVLGVVLVGAAVSVFAADTVDAAKRKAVTLVDRGVAHIKQVGKDQAFKDFTAKAGGFIEGEYYIFVVDHKGLTLAHGGNAGLVGQSMYELRDADGKLFIQEFIRMSKSKGMGWVDYKWSNPVTKKVEAKSTYVKRMEGTEYFLGCGIYLEARS